MRPPGQTDTVPEAEADALLSGKILRLLKTVLYNGVPTAARLMTSLRVGTGAATLLAVDGTDGAVMADGAAAAFFARDRADSTKYATFFRNGPVFIGTETALLWQIGQTTGLIAQAALASITAGTNVTLNPAGYPTTGTRLMLPSGLVAVYFSFTAGAAIAAFATLGTIATAAHRPAGIMPIIFRDQTVGGAIMGTIVAAGTISLDAATVNGHNYTGVVIF